MAEKNGITAQEMRGMLPWFLVVNAVYFALLLVLFFASGFDYTLLLGGVWGNFACVGNFWLMGRSAEKALRRNAKSAQSYMNTMYCLRYLGLFLTMTIAGVAPFMNLITAAVPLFFPKLIITLKGLRETRSPRNKDY